MSCKFWGKAFGDRLNYVVGTFNSLYATRAPLTPIYSETFQAVQGASNGGEERTNAVYAQGTYDLSDYVEGLSFTGGYRYTWDKQYAQVFGYNYYAGGVLSSTQSFLAHFQRPSYTAGFQYQYSPSTMFYVTNSKGFETGGFNTAQGLPPGLQTYGPESLNNIEVGVKSDFELAGVKSRVNLSGFYGLYDNIQSGVTQSYISTLNHQIALTTVEENAANAHISGVDGEFTVVPTDGVQIYLAFEYLNNKFDTFNSPVQGDLKEAPFFLTPNWKYVLRGTFRVPVLPSDGSLGELKFIPSWTWQSGVVNAVEVNAPAGDRTGEYGTLNASMTWVSVLGRDGLDVTAYGTNLLNNTQSVGGLAVYASLGFTAVLPPPPAMWGVTLKYSFDTPNEASATTTYTPPAVAAPVPASKSYLVFFDFNKSDLTPQATEIVDTAAKNAGPAKVTQLTVTGHTDTVGSDAYNMRLSRRRAESVAAQLEKDGIPSSEIEIVAKGKARPAGPDRRRRARAAKSPRADRLFGWRNVLSARWADRVSRLSAPGKYGEPGSCIGLSESKPPSCGTDRGAAQEGRRRRFRIANRVTQSILSNRTARAGLPPAQLRHIGKSGVGVASPVVGVARGEAGAPTAVSGMVEQGALIIRKRRIDLV